MKRRRNLSFVIAMIALLALAASGTVALVRSSERSNPDAMKTMDMPLK